MNITYGYAALTIGHLDKPISELDVNTEESSKRGKEILDKIINKLKHSSDGNITSDIFGNYLSPFMACKPEAPLEVKIDLYNLQNTGFTVIQFGNGLRGKTPNISRLNFLLHNSIISQRNYQIKKIEECLEEYSEYGIKLKSI
jgi:hypothetical protein